MKVWEMGLLARLPFPENVKEAGMEQIFMVLVLATMATLGYSVMNLRK
jgi:hypothetical protein